MDQAVGRREKTEETGKMPVLRLGADKARRRITFEALDSGTPRVANVGNLGDVWSALFHRGETPRHFRLILRRQALSALIFFFFVGIVNIFFVLPFGWFLLFGGSPGRTLRRGIRCRRGRQVRATRCTGAEKSDHVFARSFAEEVLLKKFAGARPENNSICVADDDLGF